MDAISGCTVGPILRMDNPIKHPAPDLARQRFLSNPWHCLSYLPYATDAVPELPCILLLHIDETKKKKKFP